MCVGRLQRIRKLDAEQCPAPLLCVTGDEAHTQHRLANATAAMSPLYVCPQLGHQVGESKNETLPSSSQTTDVAENVPGPHQRLVSQIQRVHNLTDKIHIQVPSEQILRGGELATIVLFLL
jgi:hypothetical protein